MECAANRSPLNPIHSWNRHLASKGVKYFLVTNIIEIGY